MVITVVIVVVTVAIVVLVVIVQNPRRSCLSTCIYCTAVINLQTTHLTLFQLHIRAVKAMGIIHAALLLNRARVTYKPHECALHDIK